MLSLCTHSGRRTKVFRYWMPCGGERECGQGWANKTWAWSMDKFIALPFRTIQLCRQFAPALSIPPEATIEMLRISTKGNVWIYVCQGHEPCYMTSLPRFNEFRLAVAKTAHGSDKRPSGLEVLTYSAPESPLSRWFSHRAREFHIHKLFW